MKFNIVIGERRGAKTEGEDSVYFSINVPCQWIAVFLGFYEDAYRKTAKKRLKFIQLKTKQNSVTQFFNKFSF